MGSIEELRRELHAAVDEIVDKFSGRGMTPADRPKESEEPQVVAGHTFGVWTYRWPDQQVEEFRSGRWYDVLANGERIRVRLAWTTRKAWGKDRGRAIVFQQVGSGESPTYYPLVEFVESDDHGLFASPIPNPDRPRALVTDGGNLPPRFHGAKVVRADTAFRTIENGPSLRLIVTEDDEVEMVRHGYWVARVRGRI